MDSHENTSEICEFYKDKHILLTGATGSMGKLIIEKLLRVCKPAILYLLVRPKKSQDQHLRLKELTETQLFDRLREEDPNFIQRIKILSGDVSEPGLGLSPTDVENLVDKIQVVFHGAATVKFDELLPIATKINVGGTKGILELCKKMKRLESVVHISTAYSHYPRKEIKEEFYNTPIDPEGLLILANTSTPELFNAMTPCIIGEWSNTYVFTKAVAEEIVRTNGADLPFSILRPGIITTTRSEPIPNWVNNIYGPIGVEAGMYAGSIRVARFGQDDNGELVPGDMTVNCLLAIGYQTSKMRKGDKIRIYNLTSHPENRATWGDTFQCMVKRCTEIPYSQSSWHYSSILHAKHSLSYYSLAFFLHILPALVIDTGRILLNKKPRYLKMYKRIHNGMDLLAYFNTKTWTFSMDNTIKLWKSLNDVDKKLFDFDMESLDYKPFLEGIIDGIRLYLLKDVEKDMGYRNRRYFVVYVLDRFARILLFSGLLWCTWAICLHISNYFL